MAFELLPRDGPTWRTFTFHGAIQNDPVLEDLLDTVCTPEFRGRLDVNQVRDLLSGASPTNVPRYPAPDVAYVVYVYGHPEGIVVSGKNPQAMMAQYVTLLFRPEQGGWLVHHVGDPVPPDQIPPK